MGIFKKMVTTLVVALMVTTVPAASADVSEGDSLSLANAFISGAYVVSCVNDYCPSPTGSGGYVGAFKAVNGTTGEEFLAWCSQAGATVQTLTPFTFSEISVDGRISYLTWKYDLDLLNSGTAPAYEFAAVQALIWDLRSDVLFNPDVFANTSPSNWNNITPSAWSNGGSGRIGFNTDDGNYTSVMDDATQAVYDLFVEATANAGPWTLSETYDEVTLTGANGPIANTTVTFNNGSGTTDANGKFSWPAGSTNASVNAPGDTFEAIPAAAQNLLLSTNNTVLNIQRSAAPTTTTTAPPVTTTTAAPVTTTTAASVTTTTQPPEEPLFTGGDEPAYTG